MQLVYNGPHPEVVVDELDPETVIVAGQPVDIPDDLAARLLEQDTWKAADKKAEKVQTQIDQAVATPDPTPLVESAGPTDTSATPDATSAPGDTSTKGNS